MDPISIIGLVTTAGTLASSITVTIRGLSDLRRQLRDADVRIRLLIGELSAVKSALTQINDWTHYLDETHRQADVAEGLQVSLDGCQLALDALAEEVRSLLGDSSSDPHQNLGFRMKARYAWNESSLKGHESRLHAQIAALQLLLQAVQCHSRPEQVELLQRPESRQIIQQVADDTSTLRATMSESGSLKAPPSIVSHDDSTIDEKVFEWDNEIVNAETYRRAMNHARSKSEMIAKTAEKERGIDTSSVTDTEISSEQVSTKDKPALSQSHVSLPYDMSVVSEPLYGEQDRFVIPNSSMSDRPSPRRGFLSYRLKSPEADKKSLWSTISGKRGSRAVVPYGPNAMAGSGGLRTPTPGSRRGRRGYENSYHTSIDFGSEEGLSAPAIVRAAQAGSVVEVEKLLDQRADINARHIKSGRNALIVASHCGNEEVVRLLLQHGASVNERDASYLSALHLASLRGHVDVVESLLLEHAEVDLKGPNDQTPLRVASEKSQVEIAEVLLRKQAKVNARDRDQMTPLHVAAKHGDEAMTELLLGRGAHIEAKDCNFMGALHYACQGGHPGVVGILLNKKANIEAPCTASMTPLLCASAAGKVDVVELLLKKKASLKYKGEGEMTALHWASFKGHVEVVDLLLQKKAPVSAMNKDGRIPLHLAVMAGEFAVVDLLLRKGAPIEFQCKSMLKPIHYACTRASPEITQLLLGYNANIEAEDSLRNRPLHHACTRGSLPHVQLLLQKGVSVDVRNANGDRPLCIASSLGYINIIHILLERGAAIRSKFSKGPSHEDSPLCLAAKNGHAEVVQELLKRGASVLQKDEHNWQPLRHAAFNAHPDVVEILLSHGATLSGSASGGWGFNITAERIGFSNDVPIEEQKKSQVMRLLINVEAKEQRTQEYSTSAAAPFVPPAVQNQTIPMELPDQGSVRSPGGMTVRSTSSPSLPPRATPEMSAEPFRSPNTVPSNQSTYSKYAVPRAADPAVVVGSSPPAQTTQQTYYPIGSQNYENNSAPDKVFQSFQDPTPSANTSLMPGYPIPVSNNPASTIQSRPHEISRQITPAALVYPPHPTVQYQTISGTYTPSTDAQRSSVVTLGPDGMWQQALDPGVQQVPPRKPVNQTTTTPTSYPPEIYEMPS